MVQYFLCKIYVHDLCYAILHQMEASARQMAELEEQLVHERSRKSSLESKLEREGERREVLQEELDNVKQVCTFS